jgi:hypothetical protein
MERLLGGYGWEEQSVRDWLNRNMTAEEWEFVQSIWDLLDKELYPHVAKAYEQINGIQPDKIQRVPFATPHGVFAGGYFPAKYDPVKSRVGRQQAEEAITKLYNEQAGRISVAKGFTKKRADQYEDVIKLDWGVVPAHIVSVVHYVTHDAIVRDLSRLLATPAVDTAIRERMGQKYVSQFEAWLRTVATFAADSIPTTLEDVYWFLRYTRTAFTVSTLGYSLTVAAGDLTNPFVAVASGDIKARYMAPSLAQAITGVGFVAMRKNALAKSDELNHRSKNLGRQLRARLLEIGKKGSRGPVSRVLQGARETAWVLFDLTDRLASTIIWDASYRQELAKGATEEQAVARADVVVRGQLPSHALAEQPSLLRDKRGLGALVVFYSYFSKLLNIQRRMIRPTLDAFGEGNYAEGALEAAKFAGRTLAVIVVANVFAELLSGRGPEEDEDVPQWLTRKVLGAPAMMIPIFGGAIEEAVNLGVSKAFTGEVKQRRLSVRASPAAAAVERLARAVSDVLDEESEDLDRFWALLEAAGITLALPVGGSQFQRTGRYLTSPEGAAEDIEEGDIAGVVSGVVYGERERQPANLLTPLMQ